MRELLLEGRVSWRSERSGRDRTLSIGPARILGLRRLVAALSLAAVTVLAVALVAAAAGAVAASLGARWTARRREQGLDDPVAIVQQRARQAREWLDARRSSQENAPGSDL
ncbi:MAG: hypothetical protein F4Y12_08905 [Acidimicrobiaceae bacterium]|nr:hypothetical protein [Acidimicrobiaceae bacterium]MYA85686.1 hypothetical protein [Acidimicrobiaceae bacterium]MYB88142.1 hypothetical protein [Acidimicrobiaceae bacterium]MYH76351.1 hypothetical protein [Acidimicrobiaceae bacterium]MYH94479.1 hypothetical protein [Acidimicrobiaceae bacterium]